jgi:hypothetical protein
MQAEAYLHDTVENMYFINMLFNARVEYDLIMKCCVLPGIPSSTTVPLEYLKNIPDDGGSTHL